MRLDCASTSSLVSQEETPSIPHNALCASIASFPTNNQSVMDTLLKDMLVSLQQSLHVDFTNLTQKFFTEISSLGERVNSVENVVTDITTTVNDLVYANEDSIEEMQWLQAKIADLEDRSRCNNLKLRWIPDTVQPSELTQYATNLCPPS